MNSKTPTLRRKINNRLLLMGIPAILLTGTLLVFLLYHLLGIQVRHDLETTGFQMAAAYDHIDSLDDLYRFDSDELRITVIDPSGIVLFDSDANETDMQNHLSRPEIAAAMQNGEGFARREGETLGRDTCYFAVLLQDDNIMRVSMQTANMMSLFYKVLPLLLTCLLLFVAASLLFAGYMTNRIVSPLIKMGENLDTMPDAVPYKELLPFAEEVRLQQQKKRENERIRREFTANVSHELKTPLTSISGYAELIETGMAGAEDVPVFAGRIRAEAARLVDLVEDTIRLGQMDEVPTDKDGFEQVDLCAVARDTVNFLQMQATRCGVAIQTELPPQGVTILGLPDELFHMCCNLVENAIRYNRTGGYVQIRVYTAADKVVLSVKDNGIGIPKDHQSRIFERFYRVDKSRSKQSGGTGLGLAIVKHVALRHGAGITLNSDVGRGTEISIYFKK